MTRFAWIGLSVIAALFLGVAALGIFTEPDPEAEKRRAEQERIERLREEQQSARRDVRALCQLAIEAQLKSPASAQFPHIDINRDIAKAADDPEILRLLTYVDAQNSFGAVLRTNFQCDCKKVGGRWQVVNLGTF